MVGRSGRLPLAGDPSVVFHCHHEGPHPNRRKIFADLVESQPMHGRLLTGMGSCDVLCNHRFHATFSEVGTASRVLQRLQHGIVAAIPASARGCDQNVIASRDQDDRAVAELPTHPLKIVETGRLALLQMGWSRPISFSRSLETHTYCAGQAKIDAWDAPPTRHDRELEVPWSAAFNAYSLLGICPKLMLGLLGVLRISMIRVIGGVPRRTYI